jgi:putative transposase
MVRKEKQGQVLPDPQWLMPDPMWEAIEPILKEKIPPRPRKSNAGRPLADPRACLNAIFYRLRNGGQWKSIPRCIAPPSTAHDFHQLCVRHGVYEELWRRGLVLYDKTKGIQWEWQSVDAAMTKAPLAARRSAPTRRIAPRAA